LTANFVQADGSTMRLDYVLRKGPSGWKAMDVLVGGAVSRVAVQRSDFTHLLETGGAPALTAALQQRVATLSGGALA
jgi:phospholipid transport system substrate-binding protein